MVGIEDTFVVSYCGEAAESCVSLVNSFNTLFIYLFTALASGGAVVISQYLGRKEQENASEGISQFLNASTIFSIAMALDWIVRGIILWRRYKNGSWKTSKVIKD